MFGHAGPGSIEGGAAVGTGHRHSKGLVAILVVFHPVTDLAFGLHSAGGGHAPIGNCFF